MIKLERMKETEHLTRANTIEVLESEPFVENTRGRLIHRVRRARYNPENPYLGGRLLVVDYWCKASASGHDELSFHAIPPEGKFVCGICEARSTMAGQPESDTVAGKHVHKGRVKAVRTCCNG